MNVKSRSSGFTLLEMMVAIAILAVASAAVFFSNSEALQAQQRLEEQTVAQWALANQVSYYRLAQEVEFAGLDTFANASLGPQRIYIAGYDLEVSATVLPSDAAGVRHIRWEVYRIVDQETIGPIRSLTAWVRSR
ncbi:MAG: type II secretion system minor pseudopilin GspI [Gammaproteobacteria bacterium]|nr:type II secretion system minor pseudopilin GspI [Gammaproteobacteria bacterium]